MIIVTSRRINGAYVELVQEDGRRDGKYRVFSDGLEVTVSRTILKAKRQTNAFFGENVFSLDSSTPHTSH